VGYRERYRAAGGHAVTNAAQRLGAVRFDRHAPPAAIAALPAPQLRGDRVEIDGESGGHAFENHHERRAVRFARGQKSQHWSFILSEKIAHPGRRAAGSRTKSAGADLALMAAIREP